MKLYGLYIHILSVVCIYRFFVRLNQPVIAQNHSNIKSRSMGENAPESHTGRESGKPKKTVVIYRRIDEVIMYEEKRTKVICSMKLAGYLMQRGFRPIRNAPDRKNPNYDIYLFRDSDMIRDAIDKFYMQQAIKESEGE